jgi:hypothetical protein
MKNVGIIGGTILVISCGMLVGCDNLPIKLPYQTEVVEETATLPQLVEELRLEEEEVVVLPVMVVTPEIDLPFLDIPEPITVTVPVFDAEDNVVGTEELEISLEDVTEIVESIETVE